MDRTIILVIIKEIANNFNILFIFENKQQIQRINKKIQVI